MLTQMDCFGLTHPGLKRPTNQDHYLIADLNKSMRIHDTSLALDNETRVYGGSQGKLLVVADGMGGEAEGERLHHCRGPVNDLCAQQSFLVLSSRTRFRAGL